MPIFDTHAHYDDTHFDDARDEILSGLAAKGVSLVLNCASNLASAQACAELARRYDFCYAAAGVHPHEAQSAPADLEDKLKLLASRPKVVAIGEIGLDYHYDFSPRELQKEIFERQIILANELSLPVIIHDREAHEDVFDLIKKHRPKCVFHCFSSSAQRARELTDMGVYIGLGGAVTFDNARRARQVAQSVPDELLLLETDCPYMAPVPFRGALCTSDMIRATADVIAELRGCDTNALIEQCAKNGRRLFSI